VLLWGTNDASALLIKQLSHNENMEPVGFLDDSDLTRGCTLHGLPVLGGYEEAALLLGEGLADEILVASPAPSEERIQQVVAAVGQDKVRRLRVVIEPISPP
jgi:FlaA1/EpsC-like NDP-sugar epimerase